MSRLLHDCWPIAAVVALTVMLALQIPRKALFFESVSPAVEGPSASFVVFGGEEYDAVVQRVRMSWQVRGALGPSSESRVDDFVFEDVPPLPPPLELPDVFTAPRRGVAMAEALPSLLPPSVADSSEPRPVSVAPDDTEAARLVREELLELPESLLEPERNQRHDD